MKLNLTVLAAFALLFQMIFSPGAAAQQQGEADVAMQAEAEADRLQRTLDLEDWQVFYVDSTLKHDFSAIMAEYAKLQGSKVSNVSLYQSVKDKWMDQIDATYKKIFTEEQWKEYMKTGAGKAIKAREKRKAKAQDGSKK